jgi:hypothetical protein
MPLQLAFTNPQVLGFYRLVMPSLTIILLAL